MSDVTEDTGTEIPGEVEAKARDMGWRPKEEWEGDDTNWMEADAFIERQEKLTQRADAAAQAENRKLRDELATVKRDQAETRKTLDEFRDFHSKVEQKAYERALKDIHAKQRQAVETGDVDAFEAAATEADALLKDATAKPAKAPDAPASPDEIPAYRDWQEKNAWYLDDVKLTAYADSIAAAVARKGGYTGTEKAFYDAITEEVKKEYPDSFENPNRKKAAAVEEGSGAPPGKKGRGYNDLPSEAKAACDRFIKQGLFVDESGKPLPEAAARKKYLEDYDWSE